MEQTDISNNAAPVEGNSPNQENNNDKAGGSTAPINPPKPSPKPNPFRARLSALGSLNKESNTPKSHRDIDYLFSGRPPPPAPVERTRSEIARWLGQVEAATSDAEATSPIARRASKIPRMSPKAHTGGSSDGSAEKRRRPYSFTPGMKTGLPVPSRLLNKSDGLKDTESTGDNGKKDEDAGDSKPASEQTEGSTKAEVVDTTEEIPLVKGDSESKPEVDAAEAKESDRVEVLADGTKVKRLTDRANGPVLRIVPDAEEIIMGNADEQVDDDQKPSARQSSAKKESMMSTDSFVGGLSLKRTSKASLGAASQAAETSASKLARKLSSKPNIAETPGTPSSSIPRRRSRLSTSKDLPMTPTRKPTNPFFAVDENEMSPGPNGAGKKTQTQSGDLNQGTPSGKPLRKPKLVPRESGRVRVTDGSPGKNLRYRSTGTKDNADLEDRISRLQPKRNPHDEIHVFPRPDERITPHGVGANRGNTRPAPNPFEADPVLAAPKKEKNDSSQRRGRPSITRDFKVSEMAAKAKMPTGRGVLQNFRGFFGKNKADGAKGPSNIPLPEPKPKTTKPPRPKAPTIGLSTPVSGRALQRSPSPKYYEETEDERRKSFYGPQLDHTQRPAFANSRGEDNPTMADTSSVSNLTMELLEAARRESDSSKKEKLIRMGKVLIQSINHAHDAEKAMLNAIQAAKEAEVACALAKENAAKLAQVAEEWAATELNRI